MGGGPKRVDQYLECCTNTRRNKCPRAQKVEQIDQILPKEGIKIQKI